ncbi:hypothetical protein TIFTF001_056245 [Ficus carica]|uniref:Uncharacterized protein n=1 Tax=Ficus carica TaxID=3494 RepID=A0AA88JFU2_FICCA|nr:hypothetical protein TIFTF001_056242 [Ficus carica]GMN75542.1 hypothetical protein TIFTF001_056243 [Ficus carica]GMN75543.1 hypothetical protein TIFTF001_056244 [Ficus carica]GMN75545.1 hypothetical protein TIFTF001_056245 [Ficus carica]
MELPTRETLQTSSLFEEKAFLTSSRIEASGDLGVRDFTAWITLIAADLRIQLGKPHLMANLTLSSSQALRSVRSETSLQP